MPISRETLRGYVLEEILAKLIQNTGYRLLVDAAQDPDQLANRSNGLAVRGRGGVHQVDVLGQLKWIPAFTFPIRLFVEAKARSGTSGIETVRNALGVLTDVNQYVPQASGAPDALLQRFTYRYALFSTSGFSRPAAEYALAHQLSLIDLSGAEFADIVHVADDVTDYFYGDGVSPSRAGGFIKRLRASLRVELGTWPDELPASHDAQLLRGGLLPELRSRVDALGELFVGMANGPYLLLLRAQRPQHVVEVLDQRPVQRVSISWSPSIGNGERWTVHLTNEPGGPEMTFALPSAVAAWIFDEQADPRRRAMQFKNELLSTITIYRYVDGHDRLYRLQYDAEQVAGSRGTRRRS